MTSHAAVLLADDWGWHHSDVGAGWMVVMMLGTVVVFAALIVLALRLADRRPDARDVPAQEILRRRLAEGAITVEEYEMRSAALETRLDADRPAGPET